MGYTTDFIGHVEIHPPLNEAELAYLTAFGMSRRFDRDGDPYAVPGNPAAERDEAIPVEISNRVAVGQPGYWCRWVPCWEGCCIALDGEEKIYGAARWLDYLIGHLLGPEAVARAAQHPQLAQFTFDHVLNGLVVGCRRDNKEMTAIVVDDNRIDEIVLHEADPSFVDYPPLPYEEANDRWTRRRYRRRKPDGAALRSLAVPTEPVCPE